jgi:hypothetical protein
MGKSLADLQRRSRARLQLAKTEHEAGHFVSAKRAYADAAQQLISAAEQTDDPAAREALRSQATAALDALQRLTLALERRIDQDEAGEASLAAALAVAAAPPPAVQTPPIARTAATPPADVQPTRASASSAGVCLYIYICVCAPSFSLTCRWRAAVRG